MSLLCVAQVPAPISDSSRVLISLRIIRSWFGEQHTAILYDYVCMHLTCSLVWCSFAFCQWSGGNLALFDLAVFFWGGKNTLREMILIMSFNVVKQTRLLFTNCNYKLKGNLQKQNYRSRPYTDNPISKTRFLNQLPVNSNWIPDGAWTPSSQLSERVSARCQAS
jgi:hypothetical protein